MILLNYSLGPPQVHDQLIKVACAEFERFHTKGDGRYLSLRFDLHLAHSSVRYVRLDIDMNVDTRRPVAWKFTGPRHHAAELNTFVVQTYSRLMSG
jgi:hypothetical protein